MFDRDNIVDEAGLCRAMLRVQRHLKDNSEVCAAAQKSMTPILSTIKSRKG